MVLGPLPSAVLMPVQLDGFVDGVVALTAGRDLVLNSKSRVHLIVWLASPGAPGKHEAAHCCLMSLHCSLLKPAPKWGLC